MAYDWDVVIIGSGNAGLTAGIAASEKGARVLILEKAGPELAGGNTKYTAGAMQVKTSCRFLQTRMTPGSPSLILDNIPPKNLKRICWVSMRERHLPLSKKY